MAAGTESDCERQDERPGGSALLDHPARRKGHVWFHAEGVCWTGQQAVGREAQMLRLAEVLSGRQEAREQQDLVAAGV